MACLGVADREDVRSMKKIVRWHSAKGRSFNLSFHESHFLSCSFKGSFALHSRWDDLFSCSSDNFHANSDQVCPPSVQWWVLSVGRDGVDLMTREVSSYSFY